MTNPNPSAPLWPADFQGCAITGQFLDLRGLPLIGTVTFTASPSSLLDQDNNIIVVPKVLTATLDTTGSLSIVVPATDDPNINPYNWTYSVSENFSGGRKYSIRAPQNTVIDLADVSPVPSASGAPIYRGPKGDAGGIQTLNGKTGTIVTLNAAEVGADPAGAASAAASALLAKTNNLSDVNSASATRSNLGLGTAAVHNHGDYDLAGAAINAQNAAQSYYDNNASANASAMFRGLYSANVDVVVPSLYFKIAVSYGQEVSHGTNATYNGNGLVTMNQPGWYQLYAAYRCPTTTQTSVCATFAFNISGGTLNYGRQDTLLVTNLAPFLCIAATRFFNPGESVSFGWEYQGNATGNWTTRLLQFNVIQLPD